MSQGSGYFCPGYMASPFLMLSSYNGVAVVILLNVVFRDGDHWTGVVIRRPVRP